MNYYGANDYRDYLAHHGVLGQKWGKKNGPPYPLNYKAHSSEQKSKMTAIKTESHDDKIGRLKYKVDKKLVSLGLKKVDASMKTYGDHPFLDFVDEVGQEENIYSGKRMMDALTRRVQAAKDEEAGYRMYSYDGKRESKVAPMTDGKHYDDIGEADMSVINKSGGTKNCVACSLVAELAVQGYKGITAPPSKFGNVDGIVEEIFPGAKLETITRIGSDMDSYVREKYGPGSSGYFSGSYTVGGDSGNVRRTGGHALHWNVTSSGKVVVQDGQNGKKFSSFLDACDYYGFDRTYGSKIARLDHVKPDFSKMVSNGMVSPNFSKIDGHDTSSLYSYRSYGGTYRANYDEARAQTKTDLYNRYKEYKRDKYGYD